MHLCQLHKILFHTKTRGTLNYLQKSPYTYHFNNLDNLSYCKNFIEVHFKNFISKPLSGLQCNYQYLCFMKEKANTNRRPIEWLFWLWILKQLVKQTWTLLNLGGKVGGKVGCVVGDLKIQDSFFIDFVKYNNNKPYAPHFILSWSSLPASLTPPTFTPWK